MRDVAGRFATAEGALQSHFGNRYNDGAAAFADFRRQREGSDRAARRALGMVPDEEETKPEPEGETVSPRLDEDGQEIRPRGVPGSFDGGNRGTEPQRPTADMDTLLRAALNK
jgi:hypothetical protein